MIQNISQHKYLFHHGANYRSYEFLGAHAAEGGYLFRVWAPRADAISVVGSFNDWKLDAHPMKPLADDREIWEAFVPGASVNDLYKFAVTAVHPNGEKKTVWKKSECTIARNCDWWKLPKNC